jgi:hypothetical protein
MALTGPVFIDTTNILMHLNVHQLLWVPELTTQWGIPLFKLCKQDFKSMQYTLKQAHLTSSYRAAWNKTTLNLSRIIDVKFTCTNSLFGNTQLSEESELYRSTEWINYQYLGFRAYCCYHTHETKIKYIYCFMGVVIALYTDGLRAGRPGFSSRQSKIILVSTAFRRTLGPTQPPVQCVPGVGVKRQESEADHSPPSSAEVKKNGSIPPPLRMSVWSGA